MPWLLYCALIVSAKLTAQEDFNGSFEDGLETNTGHGLDLGLR